MIMLLCCRVKSMESCLWTADSIYSRVLVQSGLGFIPDPKKEVIE